MEKLAEELAHIAEINGLIQDLQETLDLFERGNKEAALDKIGAVQASLEDLRGKELSNREGVEATLDQVQDHLEWIRENANGCGEEE